MHCSDRNGTLLRAKTRARVIKFYSEHRFPPKLNWGERARERERKEGQERNDSNKKKTVVKEKFISRHRSGAGFIVVCCVVSI